MSSADPPITHPTPLPPPAGNIVPPTGVAAHTEGIDDALFDEVAVTCPAIAEAGNQLTWINDGSPNDENSLIQSPPIPKPPTKDTSGGTVPAPAPAMTDGVPKRS